MKLLRELLYGCNVDSVIGNTKVSISNIHFNSNDVEKDSLFVAIKGVRHNGHNFILKSIVCGAVAVICETLPKDIHPDITYIKVKNSEITLGILASNFFNNPSYKIKLIGITGTNGKTSIAYYLSTVFTKLKFKTGLISTIENKIHNNSLNSTHTTPNSLEINRLLSIMVQEGCEFCFMEVSSHGIMQNRISGLHFDIAVFSNISRDHLDYHGDMRTYAATKFLLFHDYGVRNAIINTSDPFGVEFVQAGIPAKVCTFGLDESADIYPEESDVSSRGIRLKLSTPKGSISFQSSLFGRVNIINLVAVVAILLALEHTPCSIELAMSKLRPISGRMELLSSPDASVLVVVDYAHTPAALEHALRSLREYTTNQIWCVFGCGGERDLGKRSEMGAVADRLADRIVLTNDNPRSEDPLEILQQIEAGIQRNKSVSIPDRQEAISYAMSQAEFGDLVLVAGKGHETHQVMQSERRPFSDRAVVENLLEGTC